MNVKSIGGSSPYLLLDNVFTEDELEYIRTEIVFLYPNLLPSNRGNSAIDPNDGSILKKNHGLFLYETYQRNVLSHIIRSTYRVARYSSLGDYWRSSWTKNIYNALNWDSILLSYYGDGDYYKPHADIAMFTMLIWLWEEPKKFSGGNFYFPDQDYEIECKSNSGIVFLSGETHGVTPIKLENGGSGRFCISMFSGISAQ